MLECFHHGEVSEPENTAIYTQGNKLTVKVNKTIYKVRHLKNNKRKRKVYLHAFQLNCKIGDVGRFACLA